MKRIFVVLLLCASGAIGAPMRFGPEVPLTAVEYDDPSSTKSSASLATDGTAYLAVWEDTRGGVFGAGLTPTDLFIAPGLSPAVIWTGRTYIVVWSDRFPGEGILAATVSREGIIGEPRRLSNERGYPFRLATNGDTVAIVAGVGNDFVGLLIDHDLNVISRQVLASGKGFWDFDVASLNGDYLIAAALVEGSGTGYTIPLSATGAFGPATLIPEAGGNFHIAIASNGEHYLVVYDRAGELRSRVISAQNTPVGDAQTIVGRPASGPFLGSDQPRLAWRGDEWLLTYRHGNGDATALRLAADGTPIGSRSSRFGIADGEMAIAVQENGNGAIFWIEDERHARLGFFDAVSLASGMPIASAITVGRAPHAQRRPAAESVDGRLAVAWLEQYGDTSEIRLHYNGGTAKTAVGDGVPVFVDVVFDGGAFWLLWHNESARQLYWQRFTRQLEAFDFWPETKTPPQSARTVVSTAAGAGTALVVWATDSGSNVAQVVRGPGTVQIRGRGAVAAWDGTNYVVYSRDDDAIYAQHIAPSGVAVETEALVIHRGAARFLRAEKNLLAWQEDNATRVARFDGEALHVLATLGSPDALADLVALPDGGADVYWRNGTTVLHQRIADDGSANELTAFPTDSGWFDATAVGTLAQVVSVRRDQELVERVVYRTGEGGTGKRRAIR